MVKFILVVITIVFVGLAYYVSIEKDESSVKTVVKKEESTLPVEQPLKEVKKDVSQATSVENKKVVKESTIKEPTKTVVRDVVQSDNEIGEGLTLEGIENADVSDEEKMRMVDDMAYQQSLEGRKPALGEDEILKLIEKDN